MANIFVFVHTTGRSAKDAYTHECYNTEEMLNNDAFAPKNTNDVYLEIRVSPPVHPKIFLQPTAC